MTLTLTVTVRATFRRVEQIVKDSIRRDREALFGATRQVRATATEVPKGQRLPTLEPSISQRSFSCRLRVERDGPSRADLMHSTRPLRRVVSAPHPGVHAPMVA